MQHLGHLLSLFYGSKLNKSLTLCLNAKCVMFPQTIMALINQCLIFNV